MDQNEIKKLVAQYLNEGIELSEIQDILKNEHNTNMTFLELRLLASELENVDWAALKQEEETEEEAKEEDDKIDDTSTEEDLTTPEGEEAQPGNTVVEVNKLVRPGAVANGSVKFGSGASAEWVLDQFGRLGLDKTQGKPTPEDLEEFQIELQKALAGGAI